MKYIKKFESIKLPQECTIKEVVDKMNMHGIEVWSSDEKTWIDNYLKSNYEDYYTVDCGLFINNPNHKIFINKLHDNWFTLSVENRFFRRFFICDEFSELKNYLESII